MTNSMPLAQQVQSIIQRALDEDVGPGDVTSLWTLPADSTLEGTFLVKADGVLSGMEVVAGVFAAVDHRIQFTPLASDGDAVSAGDVIGRVSGPGASILTAERTALNFLQRMSGIATLTRRYVDAVAGTRAIILDTRKTVPGLRALDKWAVHCGGGHNHRFGLFDMVLIKDNHIAGAGGITQAVAGVRANNHSRSGRRGRSQVAGRVARGAGYRAGSGPHHARQYVAGRDAAGSGRDGRACATGGIRRRQFADRRRDCRDRGGLYFCGGADPFGHRRSISVWISCE